MARYIDADKFAEAICKFPAIDENAANAVISLLHRQPTADVEEVVRGEWLRQNGGFFFLCSNCGKAAATKGNFCHNCGAKMEGQ